MGHLLDAVELADLVESVNRGGKTAMQAENGVVDDSGEGQVVKKLGEVDPDIRVAVLAKAFVVEAVHLGDLAHLVISTEDGQSVLETHFQGDEEGNSLY